MKLAENTATRPNQSRSTFHPRALEGYDLAIAPLVPCLFCGAAVPLVGFAVSATTHLDGRAVSYCKCPDCWDAFARTTQTGDAVSSSGLKRWFARRDRLLRRHLVDRVLPVARALAANAEALIKKAQAA